VTPKGFFASMWESEPFFGKDKVVEGEVLPGKL
jgi:hypothetical protein